MTGPRDHVLGDVRVLDLTRALAGPSCTRLLAEMGADVVKIEPAPYGDWTRRAPGNPDRSPFYVQQNRGKKSVCVNLRDPRGIELVRGLVPRFDAVVENFRPGVMDAMGLGYEQLRELKPDVILCSISALGQTGPLAHKPGYDYIAQGYAGVTSMIGSPDEAPYIPAVGIGDVSTGAHAALALVAALRHRDRTGEGQHVDVALLDVYYHCHEENVHRYSVTRGEYEPTRVGRHMTYICPAGIFRGSGGDVVIMAHGQHWPDLCRALDRLDLVEDERFRNDPVRVANREEVIALIEGWLQSFPDVASAVAELERHDVPAGPVLSVAESVGHPHLRERGTVRTIQDEVCGEFDVPGMPLKFSRFTEPLPLDAPSLGEHNAQVLTELGLEAAQIRKLVDEGVLVER